MRRVCIGLVLVWTVVCGSGLVVAQSLDTRHGPVAVRHWGYQLQDAQPEAVAAAPHDLMVIDFAADGHGRAAWTPEQVRQMQQRLAARGRRVLLAYLCVGEASEFRDYWRADWTDSGRADAPLTDAAPAWLGPVNPDWPESRKVRYWDPDWQPLIFNEQGTGWLDRIIDQGFDGIYIDIIDGYYFWGEAIDDADRLPGDPRDGQDAARRMIQLVAQMAAHARERNSAFLLVPQNGEFILNDADYAGDREPDPRARAAYLDAINAVAFEDLYCPGAAAENNALAPDAEAIERVQTDFLRAGKPVLVVDYVGKPGLLRRFVARARGDGFVPYAAPTRGLNRLGPPAR